ESSHGEDTLRTGLADQGDSPHQVFVTVFAQLFILQLASGPLALPLVLRPYAVHAQVGRLLLKAETTSRRPCQPAFGEEPGRLEVYALRVPGQPLSHSHIQPTPCMSTYSVQGCSHVLPT